MTDLADEHASRDTLTLWESAPTYAQPIQAQPGEVFAQCGWIDDAGDLFRLDKAPPHNQNVWPVYRSMGHVYLDQEAV